MINLSPNKPLLIYTGNSYIGDCFKRRSTLSSHAVILCTVHCSCLPAVFLVSLFLFGFLLALIIFQPFSQCGTRTDLSKLILRSHSLRESKLAREKSLRILRGGKVWHILLTDAVCFYGFLRYTLAIGSESGRISLYSWCGNENLMTGDQWILLQALEQSYPCLWSFCCVNFRTFIRADLLM